MRDTYTLKRPRPATSVLRVILLVGIAALAFVLWGVIEAGTLSVSRSVLTSPDVPDEFDGVRIVFVSDVHAGRFYDARRVSRLIDTVNNQRPHLVIFGGDFVGGYSGGAEAFYPQLPRVRAPLGTFAVLGNHDGWEGIETARSQLESSGALLLENRSARVRMGTAWIRVAGVEDLQTGFPDVTRAARDIGRDEFAVLVSHNPDLFADALPATKGAFDLALAGHLHGGQITAFGIWAPVMPSGYGSRYRGGWLEEEDVQILVSRGVGTVYLPLRFFSPPQIHVIQLRRGETASVQRVR